MTNRQIKNDFICQNSQKQNKTYIRRTESRQYSIITHLIGTGDITPKNFKRKR